MGWYDLAVRIAVAAVLAVAAAGKLRDPRGFEDQVRTGPLRRAAPVAVVLPVVETTVAAGLVAGVQAAVPAAAALLAGFVAYLAAGLRAGVSTCACLGTRRTPLGRMIGLDLVLLVALLPLAVAPVPERITPPGSWTVTAVALLVLTAWLLPRRPAGRHAPGGSAAAPPGPERRAAPTPVPPGVLVFTAADCPSCHRLRPRLGGAVLVDVDEQPSVADAWGVTHTPSAFRVAADGSTTVRPAIGEEAVGTLLSGSR